MKKKLAFGIIILALLVLIGFSTSQLVIKPDFSLEFEGTVKDTLLYISTIEIDGKTTRSYATGIFLEDGSYFRIVGAQEINPGARYSFTIEPDKYGQTWDKLVKIREIASR